MDRTMQLGVVMRLFDQLSTPAARALQRMNDVARRAAGDTDRMARASASNQIREWQRMGQAREALGIRAEQAIQREISRTEAAYRRLMQSGSLTWREQARATEAYRQQVAQLRNEMGRMTAGQVARTGKNALVGGVAGASAASYILKGAIKTPAEYDDALRMLTNTAFADSDKAGKYAGMAMLDEGLKKALREGGGTRETGMMAYDRLIGSGAFQDKNKSEMENARAVAGMMPAIMKTSLASGADAGQLADIELLRARTTRSIRPRCRVPWRWP